VGAGFGLVEGSGAIVLLLVRGLLVLFLEKADIG
jgi:hypothetical protein